jgi:FMN reductase
MTLILGIGGTTRSDSSSEKALRVALSAARNAGAEIDCLSAADLDLPMYTPINPARTEKARRLIDALRRCDGLIVSSPGYHGTVSGLVKNALDYIEDMRSDDPPYLDGKPFGTIGCAIGWTASVSTLTTLRTVAHTLRAWPTPMGVAINTEDTTFDAAGNVLNSKAASQLQILGEQVVEFSVLRRHNARQTVRAAV